MNDATPSNSPIPLHAGTRGRQLLSVALLERVQAEVAATGEKQRELTDEKQPLLKARVRAESVSFVRWCSEGPQKARRCVLVGHWAQRPGDGGISIPEARQAVLSTIQRGTAVLAGRKTVEELARQYRREILSHIKSGEDTWQWCFENWILDARPDEFAAPFRAWLVRDVRREHVRAIVEAIATPRLVGKRKSGGPGIARHVLRELRGMFKLELEEDEPQVDTNPAVGAKLTPKRLRIEEKPKRAVLEPPQLRAFFARLGLPAVLTAGESELPDKGMPLETRLALALLLYVPIRGHSLNGLRRDELTLDPTDGAPPTWRIPAERLKRGRDEQEVPLCPTAVAIFRRLLELHPAGDVVLDFAEKRLTQAFTRLEQEGVFGEPADRSSGLGPSKEVPTLHTLRATWRSHADELGIEVDLAERCMGHAKRVSGHSSAAPRYLRTRVLPRQYEALCEVGALMDAQWR